MEITDKIKNLSQQNDRNIIFYFDDDGMLLPASKYARFSASRDVRKMENINVLVNSTLPIRIVQRHKLLNSLVVKFVCNGTNPLFNFI